MSDGPVVVNLQGHREAVEAFRDLKEYLPKNALRTSVRKAAELLQGFIVLTAPKRSGKLARLIRVATHKTAGTIRARVTILTQGKRGDASNAFYWRFLERGWHTLRGFHRFPFVEGVFEAKNREAAQTVIDSVEQAIDRAERKAKRTGA